MSVGVRNKKKRLGDILVEEGLMTEQQREDALKIQRETGKRLGELLLELQWVGEQDLINVLSRQMEVPHVWLRQGLIDPKVIPMLPKEKAKLFKVMPMFRVKNTLTVATADPHALVTLDELEKLAGCKVQAVLCRQSDIAKAIEEYYGGTTEVQELIDSIDEEEVQLEEIHLGYDLEKAGAMAGESPVIRFVNHLLLKALRDRASDIHIEPCRQKLRIRFRIDGILYDAISQKIELHPAVVSRLKIMSGLDIAERRLPQDGRIQVSVDKKIVDFRFSSLPGIFGEKVVLRVLDKNRAVLDINRLGLDDKTLLRLKNLLKRPSGLLLVTGPTGSGKTTTLYGGITFLNNAEKNIVTIEDPVEYQLEGINQNQVKEQVGLTFAKLLKHVLRQDPDIIMVGEIRNRETAEIAIQAALTGHLVLSTLHTIDSAGVVTRVLEMGIPPYLVASTLIGVIAQRLVRNICTECKTMYYPPKNVLDQFGWPSDLRLGRGKGCTSCYDSGYKGRSGLYEYFEFDSAFRSLVLSNPSTDQIKALQKEKGILSLFEEGLKKVYKGDTTLEELSRSIAVGA